MFNLSAGDPIVGLKRLEAQSVRTRRNGLSALATLLCKPQALSGDLAEALRWRSAEATGGAYWTLIEHIGAKGRRLLEARTPVLPACVAMPVRAALSRASRELD